MVEFIQRVLEGHQPPEHTERRREGLGEGTTSGGGRGPILRVYKKDPRAKVPVRSPDSAIGLDVFAFLLTESGRASSRAIHIKGVTAVPTGLVVQSPSGYYLQICSRSGLAARGLFVANAPGIIDPDYTGELVILLFNGSYETQYVAHEHRIAQLILQPIIRTDVIELPNPPIIHAGRGEAGFGSTGL